MGEVACAAGGGVMSNPDNFPYRTVYRIDPSVRRVTATPPQLRWGGSSRGKSPRSLVDELQVRMEHRR